MLRHLTLTRPLAVVDTETTGLLQSSPRIVEIAIIRVEPDLSMDAMVRRLNPGIPIPPAASAIHGIRDDDVATCPGFADVAAQVLSALEGCDLAGFNLRGFDLPVIAGEFFRVGFDAVDLLPGRQVLDVMRLFHSFLPLNRYGLPERGTGTLAAACHRYLRSTDAATHGALCDALASLRVLDAMIGYHRLPARFAELVDLSSRDPAAFQPEEVSYDRAT